MSQRDAGWYSEYPFHRLGKTGSLGSYFVCAGRQALNVERSIRVGHRGVGDLGSDVYNGHIRFRARPRR